MEGLMRGENVVTAIQDWTMEAGTRRVDRPWCLFGLDLPITQANLAKLFDRQEISEEYKLRFAQTDPLKKKPHSFLQIEAHLVYGAHKAFVARHKTRLQHYRDDASQKAFHNRRAVTKAFAKLSTMQAKADADSV